MIADSITIVDPITDKREAYEFLIVGIKDCPRCAEPHAYLKVRAMANPILDLMGDLVTHWAFCPVSGDPILLPMSVNG